MDDDEKVETVNLLDDDEPDSKRSKTTPEDVSHVYDDGERRNWVVMAMVTEDDAARDTYGRCRGAVRREVHDHCFVRDGARHFTLFKLNGLTRAEANRVGLAHAPTALPLDGLELTKFYDWDSCVCVGIGTEDAERLCSAVPPLRGLPARPGPDDGKFGNKTRVEGTAATTLVSRRNLHVSVYRNFGIRGAPISTPPLFLVVLATGELGSGIERLGAMSGDLGFIATFVTALLAGMLLNYALFLCTLTNSALTTTVVGVLKGVVSTALGFVLLGGVDPSVTHVVGIATNTVGGVGYSCVTYSEKQAKRRSKLKNSDLDLPSVGSGK